MKINVFNGSPRGRKGITYKLLVSFVEGINEAGAECEIINLCECNIKKCLGCFRCWTRHEGICEINDDMNELRDQFISSDINILASPIYYNNITIDLKRFIERLLPFQKKELIVTPNGVYQHDTVPLPPLVTFNTCGLPGISNFKAVSCFADMTAQSWCTQVVGKVFISESFIFDEDLPNMRILAKQYANMLRSAGSELVSQGYLSELTLKKLNRRFISPDSYSEVAKQYFERLSIK